MKPRSTRLNASNRDKFISMVVEKNLPNSAKPTDQDFKARWKSKVYDIAYGPYLERMAALPSWFFAHTSELRVRFKTNSYSSGLIFTLPKKVMMLNPHHGYGHGETKAETSMPIPEDHAMHTQFVQHRQDQTDFDVKKRELKNKIHKLAYSCNTSGQLYAAWPQATEYSDCFPYTAPSRHQGADVSSMEMDISIAVSKTKVKLPGVE